MSKSGSLETSNREVDSGLFLSRSSLNYLPQRYSCSHKECKSALKRSLAITDIENQGESFTACTYILSLHAHSLPEPNALASGNSCESVTSTSDTVGIKVDLSMPLALPILFETTFARHENKHTSRASTAAFFESLTTQQRML